MVLVKGAPDTSAEILSTLGRGGIVIMPCDTIYGIVGVAPDTENRIRSIKGRGETKQFLRLIDSVDSLRDYTEMEIEADVLSYWPGALTIIVPWREGGTIALRVPADPLLIGLMETLGRSLFSTSVNRSGEPPLWKITDIEKEFSSSVDLIISDGDLENRSPSTLLDVSVRPYRVLRQGAVLIDDSLLR